MSNYSELKNLLREEAFEISLQSGSAVICPQLGARVFAELRGRSLHRVDLENISSRDREFNNYGGLNFWPAPEGGIYGFNYDGDKWRVQPAINVQPFELVSRSGEYATVEKKTTLINRAENKIDVFMRRTLSGNAQPDLLAGQNLTGWISYKTLDSIEVLSDTTVEDGLIAAWSLEQFDAAPGTVSFAVVDNPEGAINFDYYEHPGERIVYHPKGFTYKTDGQAAGQIGIRKDAAASLIGFFDTESNLLCIRENLDAKGGTYFNIADNDQPHGPYSAADNYSIFNSGPDMGFFELETIAPVNVEDGRIKDSKLESVTTFAIFESPGDVQRFVSGLIES